MAPNGLEASRPQSRAGHPSLYASLAGKTSTRFRQLGGLTVIPGPFRVLREAKGGLSPSC